MAVVDQEQGKSQVSGRIYEQKASRIEYISYLNKCVTVKDTETIKEGVVVRIMNCEDSYIFINQKVDCLEINGCINCTVFCAAVSRVCSLMKCENVNLTVAAGLVQIGNCVDSTVNSYSHLGPPVVFGDTRSLTLAPHNASYPAMKDLMHKAGLNTMVNDFAQRV